MYLCEATLHCVGVHSVQSCTSQPQVRGRILTVEILTLPLGSQRKVRIVYLDVVVLQATSEKVWYEARILPFPALK